MCDEVWVAGKRKHSLKRGVSECIERCALFAVCRKLGFYYCSWTLLSISLAWARVCSVSSIPPSNLAISVAL